MTPMTWTYLAYLLICVGVTMWVARTLRRHGTTLLVDGTDQNRTLADAIAHSLVVGFYLCNLGIVCLLLKAYDPIDDLKGSIELVSHKVGTVLVGLSIVHFTVLAIFGMARSGFRRPRDIDADFEAAGPGLSAPRPVQP